MFILTIFSLFVCGIYGAADGNVEQQLAALKLSKSPPIAIPFSPYEKSRRVSNVPPHLNARLEAQETEEKTVKVRAQSGHQASEPKEVPTVHKSPERKKASKQSVSPKVPSDEDDIFYLELE